MRPSRIELSDSDGYDFLKPKLGELGVGCVLTDELPELQEFCGAGRRVTGDRRMHRQTAAGVTREHMESFYYAAAEFELAPWRHVPGEIPIEIRCRGLAWGPCTRSSSGARG